MTFLYGLLTGIAVGFILARKTQKPQMLPCICEDEEIRAIVPKRDLQDTARRVS